MWLRFSQADDESVDTIFNTLRSHVPGRAHADLSSLLTHGFYLHRSAHERESKKCVMFAAHDALAKAGQVRLLLLFLIFRKGIEDGRGELTGEQTHECWLSLLRLCVCVGGGLGLH